MEEHKVFLEKQIDKLNSRFEPPSQYSIPISVIQKAVSNINEKVKVECTKAFGATSRLQVIGDLEVALDEERTLLRRSKGKISSKRVKQMEAIKVLHAQLVATQKRHADYKDFLEKAKRIDVQKLKSLNEKRISDDLDEINELGKRIVSKLPDQQVNVKKRKIEIMQEIFHQKPQYSSGSEHKLVMDFFSKKMRKEEDHDEVST